MRYFTTAALLALALATPPAAAGDPPPFEDFTFKRVKPPKAGQAKRILVQIDAADLARRATPAAPAAPGAPAIVAEPPPAGRATGDYAWFWEAIPPAGPGAGGLDRALIALARPPSGEAAPSFRLETLRRLAEAHGRDILEATVGTRVSPALALAVIAVESNGRPRAVSHAGAQGLMQLMPATARRFGVRDSTVGADNIRGGVAYLDWLMKNFDNDPVLTLAGYNAGEGAVAKYAGVPPYGETRGYVPKVLSAFAVARGLCLTPPVLVSDGCVFVGERFASNG